MLLLVQNRILTLNRERTFLTQAISAAAVTLTVKAVDNNTWSDNDWVLVGEIGTQNAEILQINGAVTDGTSLTVDNAGAGGARFAHSVDEPVYRLDFNRIRFFRSATEDGAKTTLATIDLQPENFETRYDDQVNTSGYGFAAFVNSQTTAQSPYSAAIPYTGQSAASLASMIKKVRTLTDEQDDDFITDSQIKEAINDKQRDIVNERLWTFNEKEYSTPAILYQFEYDKPSQIKTLHTVRFETWPLAGIAQARYEMLNWDTQTQSSTPTHVSIWNNKVRVWPRPDAAATATALNGAISASDTTITVDSGTGFLIGDYYRFTIDSEIIYATYLDDTIFTGVLRGQEGTTPAAHADNAVVTENGIVFTGQGEPVDLEGLNDETIVPEPLVICYGVAADLCNGKLNKPTLGDRYELKFKAGIESLRDKFTLKLTSQFGRVKDPREVISDNGRISNPNDFPQNVVAPPL